MGKTTHALRQSANLWKAIPRNRLGRLAEKAQNAQRMVGKEVIYIIQCLCPNRHAIFAICYDPKDISHVVAMDGFRQLVEDRIANKTINPWCGICKSRDWTYEQRRTKYQTMEEAQPEMQRLELENQLTRMLIEQRKAEKN